MLTRQLEANDAVGRTATTRASISSDPSQGPALAFVPSTGIMFDGPLIEIDPTCVAK